MDKSKELIHYFTELRLKCFAQHYHSLLDEKKDVESVLLELCQMETEKRYSAQVKRKIKQAGFPKVKTLAMLDYDKAPKLPRRMIETLSLCKFIEQKENLILVGDSGGGKTHLAIALGLEACKKLHSVKFFTACQLVNILMQEFQNGDFEKFMAKLKKCSLLIIDEVGYVPFSKTGAELLFQVFSNRYESGSIILTSNLNFSRWTDVFIDKTMTAALLDRLTHHATIITYDWGSIRFNQALTKKKTTKKK